MHPRPALLAATALAAALALASCTAPAVPPPAARLPAPASPPSASAPSASPPSAFRDVLMLGDSQISFGAGPAYRQFFADSARLCAGTPTAQAPARAAVIGVRSTALHHWTAPAGRAKGVICDVDPAFGVNAGSYGVTSDGLSYVQIGQDPAYPFCAPGKSPLQAVFEAPAYAPDLLVLSFLGNATERWQSPATARADWDTAQALIPPDLPCLVMTTIPAFDSADNRARLTAQTHLESAVRATGRCAFVPGLTPATLAEFEGNPRHFRTRAGGGVIDPRHPTASSASRFIALQSPALCSALARVLPD